jgi:hypothetical protein
VKPLLLALALSAPAFATEALPVSELKQRYVSAVERAEKDAALDQLAVTAPRGAGDVSALLDLFSRFSDARARRAALASLALSPVHSSLEPLALSSLDSSEPETVFFGVHVAEKTGTRAALDALRALASRKLGRSRGEDSALVTERGQWSAQYEALDVLAGLEGAKTLPLLRMRMAESPSVGAIIGRRFWASDWDELRRLAGSKRDAEREAAREAAASPIEPGDARVTRAGMLAAVADASLDKEFRHLVALKAGASSDDAEAEELARRHDAAPGQEERLLWAAALFASNRPAAAPLLARYAREDLDEGRRRNAREQLTRLVGGERAKALIEGNKDVKK